jgi:hypothetical protein
MKRVMEFLEDDGGELSMTRLTIVLIVLAYIGWGSYIVWTTKAIPDLPIQVTGLLVGLYGLNRANINIGKGNG